MRARRLLLLLTLVATTLFAQEPDPLRWTPAQLREIARRETSARRNFARAGRKWTYVESKHYDVFTDVDARFAAEASVFMDHFREQWRTLIKAPLRISRRPDLFVFAKEDEFKRELKSSARGLYQYRFDGDGKFTELALYTFVRLDTQRQFTRFYHPILLHEGTHELVRETLGTRDLPKWFDEGLATYFQMWDLSLSVEENLARRPKKLINRDELLGVWKGQGFPSLDTLFAIKWDDWDPDDMGPIAKRHYSAVESLFIFLMSDPATRKLIGRFYDAILAGDDPAKELAGEARKKLEAQWRVWVEETLVKEVK